MNRISNQDIERYYFEKFCKDYPLPSGTIIYGDSPDVIVEGENRIGVEITNFFLKKGALPESEQVQSKLREKSPQRLSAFIRRKIERKSRFHLGLMKRTRSESRRSS